MTVSYQKTVFGDVEYLAWAGEHGEDVEFDFASSEIQAASERDVSLRGRSDPEEGERLEAQIADEYGPAIQESNVLVTSGATQANVLAALVTAHDTGDHILVESPQYEPLRATPSALGIDVRQFRRDAPRYDLSPSTIEREIDEATAMITITNRHNPSGSLASLETIEEIVSIAQAYGSTLLIDEVYAPYHGQPTETGRTAFGGVTAAGSAATVISSSLTKFLGYGPLRIGWLVGPERVVSQAESVQTHFPPVAEPSRQLARGVFADLDSLGAESRQLIAENHAMLAAFQDSRPALDGVVHPGSPMALLSRTDAHGDAVYHAAREHDVLVVPGRFFGAPERFRIALCGDPERMQQGLEAFGEALDSLPAGG